MKINLKRILDKEVNGIYKLKSKEKLAIKTCDGSVEFKWESLKTYMKGEESGTF